ncbi:MAG: poly-gamma-glutamate synthase PgsB [bacterium]|jgi:poly-gamma-glutamate synthase PgsB/CapB|nr:poly-gamma-glutamate synthase PgsB [bacterium]
MTIIALLLLLIIALGIFEYRRHQRHLRSIPIRIHVNGTRGKSSVTRLVAGALRAGGLATIAKTTGSAPQVILEDGSEIPIVRPRGANIIEQTRVVAYAARRGPRALVIECMAVQPEYQWIAEHRMVRSTIGVITNARPDHLREMGPTVENVARSLCNTLPVGKVAFTCEHKLFALMKREAAQRGTVLHEVVDHDVSDEDMRPFSYIEHKENVALALAVAAQVGIGREVALEGMYRAAPDCGALKKYCLEHEGRHVTFVNALAANDPESTLAIWQRVTGVQDNPGATVFILNTRKDRFERSEQLVEMVHQDTAWERLILIGEVTDKLLGVCYRMGLPQEKVVNLGTVHPELTFNTVINLPFPVMTVMGIGNVHGGGHEVAHYFRDRSAA